MNGKIFFLCIILALLAIVGTWYINPASEAVRWIMHGLILLGTFVCSAIYLQTWNDNDDVRIYLDVVLLDNQIDLWRGKLCEAQHNDDLEGEAEAMIRIDTYQDLRVSHGLEALPRV